jgi:hypothetical protein
VGRRGGGRRGDVLACVGAGRLLGPPHPPSFPEGVIPTGLEWYRFAVLGALRVLLSLFAISFVGGVVTGAAVPAVPGPSGILGAL